MLLETDLMPLWQSLTGLSLKRDPVDRDRAEDQAKRPGPVL